MKERIERLKKRDGVRESEILKRMNQQMPEEDKVQYADYIIQNANDSFLIDQVLNIHSQLLQLCV
jgi:dephospho-CoA kinase